MVFSPVMNQILKRYLETEGVSISEFASAIGVKYETARRYLSGERIPRPVIQHRIVRWSAGAIKYSDLIEFSDVAA